MYVFNHHVFDIFRALWIYSIYTDCWHHQQIGLINNMLDIFQVYCAGNGCAIIWHFWLSCGLFKTGNSEQHVRSPQASIEQNLFGERKKKYLGKHEHMVDWVLFSALSLSRKWWSCRTLSMNQLQNCYPGNLSSQNS